MTMEKYGVKCRCAENEVPPDGKLVKLGGQMCCPDCGRNWRPAPVPASERDEKK
jgi:hypothetical protein